MIEKLSREEHARRRSLARIAVSVGVPAAIVLVLALIMVGVLLGIGPFSPGAVMSGAPAGEPAGVAAEDEAGPRGKAKRTEAAEGAGDAAN